MKKIAIVLIVTLVLFLCSCSSQTATTTSTAQTSATTTASTTVSTSMTTTTTASSKSDAISVDKNLLNVKVTLPASLFTSSNSSQADIEKSAKEQGVSEVIFNQDGSVTYVMSKQTHQKMLDGMKKSADESIAEMLAEKDTSFKAITYNTAMSEFEVKVDASKYSKLDSLSALSFYIIGSYYQALSGVDSQNTKVVVNFVDNNTGKVLNTADSSQMKK